MQEDVSGRESRDYIVVVFVILQSTKWQSLEFMYTSGSAAQDRNRFMASYA